jgi:RNA polymerase sigma-70 factor, ECF subfamily
VEVAGQRQMELAPASAAPSPDAIVKGAPSGARLLARKPPATVAHAGRRRADPDVRAIYDGHARFVWLTLQRMGVRPRDLEDVAQEVFVVVHRRLDSFDGTSRMTTWLFGICKRVAANYRRGRTRAPSELAIDARARDEEAVQIGADEMLSRREDRAVAEQILAKLSLEKRAVLTMFEIEGLSCQEIAELIGIPIGTVYSRLHAARTQVERLLPRSRIAENDLERRK